MSSQQQPQIGGQQSQFGGQQTQFGTQSQYGQPGQQVGGQQTQATGQQSQATPGTGRTFEESLSGQMRLALHDFVKAHNVTSWCADQCLDIGPQMATCVRLCEDVEDVAELNVDMITRDSWNGPRAAELFIEVAQECAQECAQHQHAHCQECAAVLTQAANSTKELLNSLSQGQQAGQQTQYGQPGQQGQFGGQQTQVGQTGQQAQYGQTGQPTGQQSQITSQQPQTTGQQF